MFPLLLFFFLFLELIFVSYLDFKYKKIKNIWSVLNLIVFIICIFVYPNLFLISFDTFFYPIVFLGVGFVLFTLKVMGGGDSKFLFSFFLLVPEAFHEVFFMKLIYSTIMIGLILLLFNTIKNFDKLIELTKYRQFNRYKEVYGTKFAYAPVIGISWIIFGWEIRKLLQI